MDSRARSGRTTPDARCAAPARWKPGRSRATLTRGYELPRRVERDLSNLLPLAQKAAAADLEIIEAQMRGYEARLDLWYRRLWDLHGLWLDPAGRMVRHKGREAALTKREFQLLQFLLDHPHRYYTAQQILNQAWVEPALFPEEVRNYVRRLRTI